MGVIYPNPIVVGKCMFKHTTRSADAITIYYYSYFLNYKLFRAPQKDTFLSSNQVNQKLDAYLQIQNISFSYELNIEYLS